MKLVHVEGRLSKLEAAGDPADFIFVGLKDGIYSFSAKGVTRLSEPTHCAVPPQGWSCTRLSGHDGPCAAFPEAQ